MPNYADILDDLSAEVTTLLWQAEMSNALHCSINEFDLAGESMEFNSDGNHTLGINHISYQIEYIQEIRLPTDLLDNLESIHNDMQDIQTQVKFI